MGEKILSNKMVALMCIVLFAAIMLDGHAFNRPPARTDIFTLPVHPDIKIKKDDEVIMAFENRQGRWHLTEPFAAPAYTTRVEALLNTNIATKRQYSLDELEDASLFTDAVTLEIDNHQFRIGPLEPVSELRYVQATDTVYLQADNVIPLLEAGQSAFVDLMVTSEIRTVSINKNVIQDSTPWSNLRSIGLIDPGQINSPSVATVSITAPGQPHQSLDVHSLDGIAVLIARGEGYGYLLSAEQAETLGLLNYL